MLYKKENPLSAVCVPHASAQLQITFVVQLAF